MTATRGPRLACMISAKNLGDAAGHSSVVAELLARGYADRFLVWTKPDTAFLFSEIPACEVVMSPLPLGTANRFGWRDVAKVIKAARAIRARRPEVTMDLVGDQRERWLARLAGSRRHLQIGWADGHPFNRLIRNPFGKGRPLVTVPATTVNVYEGYRLFVERLMQDALPGADPTKVTTAFPGRAGAASARGSSPAPGIAPRRIGLHPFASQRCKSWLDERWLELARRLSDAGHAVTVFGAPSEAVALQAMMRPLGDDVRLSWGSLGSFEEAVRQLDLMIGLDSFSIHLAEHLGVPSLMLNAGNPAELWAPPRGRVIGNGGGCPHHPCYNVPRCDRGAEYVCIRATTVDDAARGATALLAPD